MNAAVNAASFAAANLVYDFASRFDKRADYRPIEELAQRVQAEVIRTFCRVSNAVRTEAK